MMKTKRSGNSPTLKNYSQTSKGIFRDPKMIMSSFKGCHNAPFGKRDLTAGEGMIVACPRELKNLYVIRKTLNKEMTPLEASEILWLSTRQIRMDLQESMSGRR